MYICMHMHRYMCIYRSTYENTHRNMLTCISIPIYMHVLIQRHIDA